MQFRILGPLEGEMSGELIDLGSSRQRQLLALLLMYGGEAVSTDRLVEGLWSGQPPETARHTLQTYVHRLRAAFGSEGKRLEGRATGYRLKLATGELDALRFESLADEGRRSLSAGDPERAADLLAEALGLWRGPVLSDLPDLVAFEPERARLDGMRLAVLEDRVEADLALGRHAELVPEVEALVSEHPLRERLWGQLMLALYRSGRQADALAAFRRARKVLEELGIDPGPRLAELEGQILLQDPVLTAPRTERHRPAVHNLPLARTTFVGRRRELVELEGLLRARRLVTITGPPGAGKTRLAVETARRLTRDYPHGTFLVSLSDVEDPELIPSLIDAVLGVPASGQPLPEALMAYVRPRRLLLVLDNFEHILSGAELVGRLLDAAPGLVVLATSRAPLRLAGEQEYPLEPLPLPSREQVIADPSSVDALALFADRARAIDPDFALSSENAPLVADVVNRLDRLPLAIELAAPRLRLFPLAELHQRLGPLLPQLTEGPVDAPARQRTLRDAMAWSYDLLQPVEQSAFRRLAVFRGGFTLEAADAVAGAPPVQDITTTISRLVQASLIERPVDAGPARFSLLETVREYGLEQLHAAEEAAEIARGYAEFYAGVVEQAEPRLAGPDHREWLERLTAEQPNLRAVLAWARDNEAADLGLLMAGRMWRFWQFRGALTEGRHWLEDLLGVDDDVPSLPRVKALIGLGQICYWLADLDVAQACYRQARELLEHRDDWWLRAEALFGEIITLACHRGEVEAAMPLQKEFQSLATRHQHPALVVMGHVLSGTMLRFGSGDLEEARPHGLEALTLTRNAGDRWWEGEILRALGQISYEQGRHQEAEDTLRESLDLAWELGHQAGVAIDLNWLGLVAVIRGRPEQGVVLAGAASRLRQTVGGAFTVQHYRHDAEQPEEAARRSLTQSEIDTAWARGRAMSLEQAVSYARAPSETATV